MHNTTSLTEQRITALEEEIARSTQYQSYCQAETVPKIVDERIHLYVNGKFNTISESLASIRDDQVNVAADLRAFNTELIKKLIMFQRKQYTGQSKDRMKLTRLGR